MGWFGPSKDEVWQQLCQEIGADFVAGGFWGGGKVQAHVGPWTITLDTFTVSDGHTSHTLTRMRAPYVNPDGFRFTIYRKGVFSELGKLLGMQDIEVGDPDFDEAFIIKGSDEYKVRDLFSPPQIRALLQTQPAIRLEVKDDEGWFQTRFPDGVDELHFQTHGVIRDVERLKKLYDLFAEILDRLCRIGSATKDVPGVEI
ncbi:MAG TPA: DUF3137 domain-containing protein [Isosphaeraceae bacterium]|jgi:hypothetical protein|nr:DUF3137 domain-containing protein [Isosphaeraceae bacterium]